MYTPDFEFGVPFATKAPNFATLSNRVDAVMKAVEFAGSDIHVTVKDQSDALRAFENYDEANKDPDAYNLSNPAVIVHLKAVLNEYDAKVVHDTASLRNYITNKLLEETTSENASIRMKALELLGKISDVGLFTEKTEVTYRHRSTEDLERLLHEKLASVIDVDFKEK